MNSHSTVPRGQAHYALAILLLAYILSFIDRNVMAVLIGPIRAQFEISDFQYSLLHGFAFSIFYVALGLPIARLADQHNRKWIVTVGIFCWSVMTCLCGAARGVATLFMARIGVGVGEAALSPAAYSMLADLYPPGKLARAISVYCLGITLGGGLAYIIGSTGYEYFSGFGEITLPLFGAVNAWQMTFIAVGAPGLLVVLLMFLVQEPKRVSNTAASTAAPSVGQVVAHLKEHRLAYLGIIIAPSLMAMLGYGTMAWYVEHLIRSYGMTRTDAGSQFGLVFIIAGSIGVLAGGWSVQPLFKRGYLDAPMRVILFVALAWLIPGCLGPLASTPQLAMLAAWPIIMCLNFYLAPLVAGIQLITPNKMRAQISALMIFNTNLWGLALGPSAIALLTDFVFGDDQDLRYSMALMPLLILIPAIALMLVSLKAYRRAVRALDAPV